VDSRLLDIARGVEASGETYTFPLIVQVGAALVIGKPAPSSILLTSGRDFVWQVAQKSANRKAPPDEIQRGFISAVAPLDAAFAQPTSDVSALTLSDVEWWPTTQGDGLALPAMRIPFESVSAWWIARGAAKKLGSGGGWFVGAGISFPID
jgi:hypothetical protein